MKATGGQGRHTDFAKSCQDIRTRQLVEGEGGRKIHEFTEQILVGEGLPCT